MSKKKKKKNKKNRSQVQFQNNPNNNIQEVQSATFAAPVAAVATASVVSTPINKEIRRDLTKIFFISLFLVAILAGCLVIRTQTTWLTRGADAIYGWMRLGE